MPTSWRGAAASSPSGHLAAGAGCCDFPLRIAGGGSCIVLSTLAAMTRRKYFTAPVSCSGTTVSRRMASKRSACSSVSSPKLLLFSTDAPVGVEEPDDRGGTAIKVHQATFDTLLALGRKHR